MYAEIDNSMIVRTIAAYEELTDHIHERLTKNYDSLKRRLEQREKDELIFVASIPGGELAKPVIPKDVSDAYTHYIELCREQIRDTYRSVIELTERQETMNRIMACYNLLPQKEHQILQILYEESGSYKEGVLSAISQLDITKATIDRRRKNALVTIREKYDSDLSQMALIGEKAVYR